MSDELLIPTMALLLDGVGAELDEHDRASLSLAEVESSQEASSRASAMVARRVLYRVFIGLQVWVLRDRLRNACHVMSVAKTTLFAPWQRNVSLKWETKATEW